MSNEPENRVQDGRVTDAYRALGGERAPESLNQQVLRMAAAARTPYARARAWMRPAAWAATIGLSLALVLELTQLPSVDPDYVGISSTTDNSTPELRQTAIDDPAAPIATRAAEPPRPEQIERSEPDVDAESKREAIATDDFRDSLEKKQFALRENTVVREAHELARAQSGTDSNSASTRTDSDSITAESAAVEPMPAELAAARRDAADRLAAKQVSLAARSAAASLAATGDVETAGQGCPASERKTPQLWLVCIGDLRKRGLDEQAEEEYEEFRRKFPEFDDSVTDK
jgi:hypothetical protein